MADIFVAPKHAVPNGSQNMNTLSSFCKNPKGISFQTQKPDEKIILFLRSHFITNLSWIIFSVILVFLPIIVILLLPLARIDLLSSSIAIRFTVIYILFYYLMVFSYLFISFLHWFYSVFMVTSQQVVDIDYSDIVIHHVAVTNLSQLQDAKYTQSGFISTFFNYGDIFVQTAGTQPNFQEPSVPKPREATHIIGDIIGKGKI